MATCNLWKLFLYLLALLYTVLSVPSLRLEIPSNSKATPIVCFIVLDRQCNSNCQCCVAALGLCWPSLTLGSAGLAWPDWANLGMMPSLLYINTSCFLQLTINKSTIPAQMFSSLNKLYTLNQYCVLKSGVSTWINSNINDL